MTVARLWALAVGVLLAGSALTCRSPSADERRPGARANSPAPSGDGTCQFDLSSPKDEAVFFVLGTLDEYLGRTMIEGDDLVEHFYCNEHAIADVFTRRVVALAREQGLDPAVRSDTVQSCLIDVRSRILAEHLNSCYRFEATDRNGFSARKDSQGRPIATASLGLRLFMRQGVAAIDDRGLPDSIFYRRRALAYLAGAWLRYGRDPDFVFTNAREKAQTVADLLYDLGCHGIRIESTVGLVPQGNTVHFTPTDEVAVWLKRQW